MEADWAFVSWMIIHRGTTARCMTYRERAGRLKATSNFFERKISNLVVIGRFRQQ